MFSSDPYLSSEIQESEKFGGDVPVRAEVYPWAVYPMTFGINSCRPAQTLSKGRVKRQMMPMSAKLRTWIKRMEPELFSQE